MGRQIVVCCDGTWNVPDEVRQGVAAATNVAKLALALSRHRDDEQLLFYEPGVGTETDDRVSGGAFGYGLSRNIRDCYRYLALNYEKDDELYLFGFSRGAYTARSLAGLIRNCGLLEKANADKVDDAFAMYRDRSSHTHPCALSAEIFRREYSHDSLEITFIGVWDTVGALGIPAGLPGWEEISRTFQGWEQLWGFHDTQLSRYVRHAAHALAIDEQRAAFAPTLWTQDPQADQELAQVWFSGVHSEIGGGSKDATLSDIALLWMIDQARTAGLRFDPQSLAVGTESGVSQPVTPYYAGPLIDSRRGMYKVLHAYHRLRELPVGDAPGQFVATSAERRFRERVNGYDPPGLDGYLNVLKTFQVVESSDGPLGQR
jgi:uncharacterized protein (DUF2235 family)